MGLALSLVGALALPLLTGSLVEFWRQPVAPFGALSVVSLRSEMMLLCDRFVEARVPCEPGKLDTRAATAYVPTAAVDRNKAWALARDLALGLFTPALLTAALWRLWRAALERLGRACDPLAAAEPGRRERKAPGFKDLL